MIKVKISGYPNYEISENGEVNNIVTGNTLKPALGSHGYLNVTLYNKGKVKCITIHRQLAVSFIPNPNNYRCTNHIDGNKLNNDLSNLEWCSHSHNNTHALRTGLRKSRNNIILNMETGIYYQGVADALSSLPKKKPYHYLHLRLSGELKNKTSLKYV